MRLLIITPTLYSSPWLNEMRSSVRALSEICAVRHVLVVPRASISELKTIETGVEIVRELKAEGMYAALNRGLIERKNEEYITWLNDDDIICPAAVAATLQEIHRLNCPEAIYGRVRMIGSRGNHIAWCPTAHRRGDLLPLMSKGVIPFAQPGTLVKATLFDALGGFDEHFKAAGDLEFFARALSAGARFQYVDREVARFRLRSGQLSKSKTLGRDEKSMALSQLTKSSASTRMPTMRFFLRNIPVYFDRIRRHGFRTMEQIYNLD